MAVSALAIAAEARAAEPGQVLLAPVQGSDALPAERKDRLMEAVRRALEARGYDAVASNEHLEQAVVACQSLECVEQVLDAAAAEFALVPALWLRDKGSAELTLTLVQRQHRSLNATGPINEDFPVAAEVLIDELLRRRDALLSAPTKALEPPAASSHPHAWKAGPIILLAAGTAAFVAIGAGAAIKNESRQLNRAAVGAWSAIGAAALAGGVAWWVVGAKRRRPREAEVRRPRLVVHPARVDLRLRF